jgi:hypothetical protein
MSGQGTNECVLLDMLLEGNGLTHDDLLESRPPIKHLEMFMQEYPRVRLHNV